MKLRNYLAPIVVAALVGCSGSQPPVGATGAIAHGAGARVVQATPTLTAKGNLYGTTSEGGDRGGGTVFEIEQSGQERIIHSFGRKGDGIRPVDGLRYVDRKLYGTTLYGGAYGYGTVFSVSLSGAEKVLHSFGAGSADGANPSGRLLDVGGTLYGTTLYGGKHNWGTVFSISKSGTETIVHSFGFAPDGVRPYAGVIEAGGTLYGTTLYGGAQYNLGTVYAISGSGVEKVLHSFGGGDDGWTPYAPLHNVDGTLYGTTFNGGANGLGTIFAITTSGVVTVLHSFGGPGDGANPYAPLNNVGHTLYGTTYYGGAYNYGTVFMFSKSGSISVLHSFSGSNPIAALHDIDGTLYGTTWDGGDYNLGTVFTISKSGRETKVYSFRGGPGDGANPFANLIEVRGTP